MNRSVLALALLGATALVGCRGSHGVAMSGTVRSTAPDRAIFRVQASRPGRGFASYPNAGESKPCVIHGGGPAGLRIKGTCRSKVSLTHGRRIRAIVAFVESWHWKRFHYSGSPHREQHHSWRFAILASGRVVPLSEEGDFPPQYAK
jgi:hypothetical protein